MIFVALYVADLIIASSSNNLLRDAICALCERYEMTDMVQLKFFLGIEIERDESGGTLSLRQSKFGKGNLKKFGMLNSVRSPQDSGLNFSKAMCEGGFKYEETMETVPYRNAVGCSHVSHGGQPSRPRSCSGSAQPFFLLPVSNTLARTQEGFSVHKW